MDYVEIEDEKFITATINKIRERYSNWRQIVASGDRETTMRGKSVVTLYLKFEPVCQVEGDPEDIELFVAKLRELSQGGTE